MNYEIVKNKLTNRGFVQRYSEIDFSPFANEFYISLFGFDNSIYDYLSINENSVSGFSGNYFAKAFYFDVDNEDVELAQESAKVLVKALYHSLAIHPKDLQIYFSGAKGFHIRLDENLFSGFEPSKDLPKTHNILSALILSKAFEMTLQEIEAEIKSNFEKEKIKRVFRGIDLKIYNANRIFRVENSINSKSGLYKIQLTANELFNLKINEIKDLAKKPRFINNEKSISQLTENQNLVKLLNDAITFDLRKYEIENSKQQTYESKDINFELFCPSAEGSRNDTLFRQACALINHSNLHENHIRQLIENQNALFSPPLQSYEVNVILKSAYKTTKDNQKFEGEKKDFQKVKTFFDLTKNWIETNLQEKQEMTMLIDCIDKENKNNFRGKFFGFIGGAGTLKSYFAQNVMIANIRMNNCVCAYSQMEMSEYQTAERLLDMSFDTQNEDSFSTYLEKNITQENKELYLTNMKDNGNGQFDNLIINTSGSMQVADYEKWILKIIELYGKIDILVVDGLSMMGGSGSEFEVVSKNTSELKTLANKYNILVIAIIHLTKDIPVWKRNNIKDGRGSGKITDNLDCFLGFSKIIDTRISTLEDIVLMESIGHIRYWGKRVKGLEANIIFEFDERLKIITESETNASAYPTYEQFEKELRKETKNKF
jgi:hypothetical protein